MVSSKAVDMLTGRIASKDDDCRGVNYSAIARLNGGGVLFYKRSESAMFERCAYVIATILNRSTKGYVNVPATVVRDDNGYGRTEVYSEFIDGRTVREMGDDLGVDHWEYGYMVAKAIGWDAFRAAGVFDIIIANDDRHSGNAMIDSSNKLWLIDHGNENRDNGWDATDYESFPRSKGFSSWIGGTGNEYLSDRDSATLNYFVSNENRYKGMIDALVGYDQRCGVYARAASLLVRGKIKL